MSTNVHVWEMKVMDSNQWQKPDDTDEQWMSRLFLEPEWKTEVKRNVLVQNRHHQTEHTTVHQILLLCSSKTCTKRTIKTATVKLCFVNNCHNKMSTCNITNNCESFNSSTKFAPDTTSSSLALLGSTLLKYFMHQVVRAFLETLLLLPIYRYTSFAGKT